MSDKMTADRTPPRPKDVPDDYSFWEWTSREYRLLQVFPPKEPTFAVLFDPHSDLDEDGYTSCEAVPVDYLGLASCKYKERQCWRSPDLRTDLHYQILDRWTEQVVVGIQLNGEGQFVILDEFHGFGGLATAGMDIRLCYGRLGSYEGFKLRGIDEEMEAADAVFARQEDWKRNQAKGAS